LLRLHFYTVNHEWREARQTAKLLASNLVRI